VDITCISDCHGYYPKLEGGDLLIVGGDLTASDKEIQYKQFYQWLENQSYKKIVYIGGNHDNYLQKIVMTGLLLHIEYLCDSGTEFEGLKIWGSPWTLRFEGMNPNAMAFTVDTEEELAEKWALIPDDVDILVTHSPPYGYFDYINGHEGTGGIPCGSTSLFETIHHIMPKLHVFGHIHEEGGSMRMFSEWYGKKGPLTLVNASHVNELYEPVNKPIRIEL